MLVALAILGIGLGVIFQGLGQGLRLRRDSAENVRFALIAEHLLGGLASRKEAPDEAEEGEEGGWRWKVEALATPPSPSAEDPYPGPRLVEVRCSIEAPSGRRRELTTLLPEKPAPKP